MYYLLKILSYSPVFNIVGSDSNFGDIELNSSHIRFSLLGFTIIYYFAFISFYYEKSSKKITFSLFRVIKYPIKAKDQKKLNCKVANFRSLIENEDDNCKRVRLDSIKTRIDGQEKNTNISLMKAGYILPVFIGLFIYILQSQLLSYPIESNFNLIPFYYFLFCYFATSINILYFLSRLTKVSAYGEISLPKGNNESELLSSSLVEYYEKFINNESRSLNFVSYNIWVQDYFKKFFVYSTLLLGFILLTDSLHSVNPKDYFNNSNIITHSITYNDSSYNINETDLFLNIVEEINSSAMSRVVVVSHSGSLNLTRIRNINNSLALLSRNKFRVIKSFTSSRYLKVNNMLIIIEKDNNE